MYIYNFGYGSYEDSVYYQLYHEEKYSEDEFREILHRATVYVLLRHLEEQEEHLDKGDEDLVYFSPRYENLVRDIRDILISDFGFSKLKFEAEVYYFGWANILTKGDWSREQNSNNEKLTEYLAENLKAGEKKRIIKIASAGKYPEDAYIKAYKELFKEEK